MRPLPYDRFHVWPLSRAVNSVKNDGPELLEPLGPTEAEPVLL